MLEEAAADQPLSPEEVARMREHLRFLRDHRKALRLQVNAQEDLLLNGVREPTHRGVCMHLLAKLDKSRVEAAAQRMTAEEATRLLGGIVRFSPDPTYLLMYLEQVRRSRTQREAAAALASALAQIDFQEVSHAQMRRVLELTAEIFSGGELASVLFGLLRSRSFRGAFDDASTSLPDALASRVLPLRAVQAVVFEGRANPCRPEHLGAGVAMLLQGPEATLRGYPEVARRRLLELGVAACRGQARALSAGLSALWRLLPKGDPNIETLGLRAVGALLADGLEGEARAMLAQVRELSAPSRTAEHWWSALAGERLGPLALPRSGRPAPARPMRSSVTPSSAAHASPTDTCPTDTCPTDASAGPVPRGAPAPAAGAERLRRGLWVAGGRSVWVRLGAAEEQPAFAAHVELISPVSAGGLSPLVAHGTSADGRPFLATLDFGPAGPKAAAERLDAAAEAAPELCRQGVCVLAELARAGLVLPDATAWRFSFDGAGRVWLHDAWGARAAPVDAARAAHLGLARGWCESVLGAARRYAPSPRLGAAVSGAQSLEELATALLGLA